MAARTRLVGKRSFVRSLVTGLLDVSTPPPITLRSDGDFRGDRHMSADLDVLLRRVANRDRDAFAAFYDQTSSRVYG